MALKHTPYDGTHPLFKIGLEPLDLGNWIEVDEHLDTYLEEKARLRALYGEGVFVAEDGTGEAQNEALTLLVEHLCRAHGSSHRLSGSRMIVGAHDVDLSADAPALEIASKLVQEDLVLMRNGPNGWRLAAASLCFPSSWSLFEKFGKSLDQIHETVPGFEPGSKNASVIFRIFDNLKIEQPVRRFNWSIYSDNELFHDDRVAEDIQKQDFEKGVFLRVEHQTLRKLPKSGDILFTIRIHIDPLKRLSRHPDRAQICKGAVSSLQSLDAGQLNYKGLTQERDRLIEKLAEIGEGTAQS